MLDIFKKLYSFYSDYIPLLESLYSDSEFIKYLAKNQYLAIVIPACGAVIAVFITVPLFFTNYLELNVWVIWSVGLVQHKSKTMLRLVFNHIGLRTKSRQCKDTTRVE